ncbi:MAG: hypothetical protein KY442_00320 [Proteobacteria bacterium]|nr:hypothetical protein [Pseudomonadota bacterium]
MKRWAQRIFGGLAVVALGLVTLYTVSRLRGPSAGQEAALALMEQPMDTPGRNAFATLWLLDRDVPPARLEQIAELDIRRFADSPLGSAPAGGFRSVAAAEYPALEVGHDEEPALCALRETGCLAQVRSDRAAYAGRIDALRPLIRRAEGLSAYGHYRNRFAPRMDRPLPQVGNAMSAQRTAYSLAFVDGDVAGGLAGVCGMAETWRRFVPHSNSLIVSMLAINTVTDASTLFAEMLAELPADYPLPAECATAFAPPRAGEGLVCEALKGEFDFTRRALQANPHWRQHQPRGASRLFYDQRMTEARSASAFAQYCNEQARERFAADAARQPAASSGLAGFDCLANSIGCLLADVAAPAYVGYARRGQDHAARRRLMATLLALRKRSDDPRPLQARLDAQPPVLRSANRPIEPSDNGAALRITLFDDSLGADHWQVPLPPELRDE